MTKPKPQAKAYNLRIDEGDNERLLLDARRVRADKIPQILSAYLAAGPTVACDLRVRVAEYRGHIERGEGE